VAIKKRILVVDDSPDMLELSRILLSAEGYEVLTSNYAGVSLASIKAQAPQAIIFDLVKDQSAPWSLMAGLRQQPETRDIGVMVTSASTSLLKRAVDDASLAVSSGLLIPFDIDDLYERLKETINHARAPTAGDNLSETLCEAHGQLAQALRQQHRAILFRWVQRAATLPVFQRHPSLTLEEMMGEMGAVLDTVSTRLGQSRHSLSSQSPTDESSCSTRRHAMARQALDARPGDLVREFQLLRMEISHSVVHLPTIGRVERKDLLMAQICLDETLDHLLAQCIDAFDQARAEQEAPVDQPA
jgi:DNA-binding response OmpR family regulator